MKSRSLIFCCIVFVLNVTHGQSKYAIGLIGGKTLDVDNLLGVSNDGLSGGVGADMAVGPHVDITANVVFSIYSHGTAPPWIEESFSPATARSIGGQDAYTCAISVGPRIHARSMKFVSPYILMQGGVYFMRYGVPSRVRGFSGIAAAAGGFFGANGSADIDTRFFGSVGVGLEVSPTNIFNVDLETKIQAFEGEHMRTEILLPLLVSIEFPL